MVAASFWLSPTLHGNCKSNTILGFGLRCSSKLDLNEEKANLRCDLIYLKMLSGENFEVRYI